MKIRVDYEAVRRRAQEIGDCIQRLNAQKVALRAAYNNLGNAWQGEAASVFKRKLDELIRELETAIKEMTAIKQDILITAAKIKNTDEQLASEIVSGTRTGVSRLIK